MSELNKCRVCKGPFLFPALLEYPNSPRSAQGFLDNLEKLDDVVDLKIYQCQQCGLVQHDLKPVDYYKDVIRAIAYSEEMGRFREKQLAEWIHKFNLKDKKILEIGSGQGEYLELLLKAGGKNVYGVENSKESIEIAKQKGLNIQQGYLSKDYENSWAESFDAFATFNFMEHWPDIRSSLHSLQNSLNESAVGLVEVPNFDFMLKNGMYSEFTTDHIFYFTEKTLRTVLETHGFDVIEINSIWHDYILSAQVKKRPALNISGFSKKQNKIVKELRNFVNKFKKNEVIIWGAGHQALAVISISKLDLKVSHVVDSAKFKQNKYTPGTHLLIKDPQSIHQDLPKAIIIMAAAYSDEVAKTLNSQYPEVKNIAILREDGLEVINDK
jgi:cyclopropane fatty-acyl-phospholipid synthase-like methyltransferase